MEEATGDTTGSGGGGDGRAAQDSVESVSGVTEAATSGNAAGEKARQRQGVAGGEDDGLLAVVDRAVGDDGGVEWEVGEVTTADGDEAVAAASSVWHAAARLGWLLLGFLAGAAVAAAVLFLMRDETPVTCTVVPT